jgi:N-acyl-D-amino-acid deacylase
MNEFDLVIRGGTILDGSGGAPFDADVAIRNGRIASIGNIAESGVEEINAKGMIVTPGFVDIHTHYDGQATWDNRLFPSSAHGVTTVLMGNCGVGFAPCRPQDRERLVRLMEGVEDLPEVVLTEGLPWSWESFGSYLDVLDARRFDVDIATQIPHSALRVFVMGERAIAREMATPEDCIAMARLAGEAIDAGALGFATSRTINHRSSEGWSIPTLTAAENELVAISKALGGRQKGVLQAISDFTDVETELAMLRRVAEASKRPMSLTLLQLSDSPDKWRTILSWIEACNADGLEVRGQVSGRMVGILMGFELTFHPFMSSPSWQALAALSLQDRRAALHDPEVRSRLIEEKPLASPYGPLIQNFENMYPLDDTTDYEPAADKSIAALAVRQGISAAALAYDLLLENGGTGMMMAVGANYAQGNLDPQREMLVHPNTIYGLGDGGAHLGFLCDASLPTFMLQHWARDRPRGDRLPLAEVVRGLSFETARAVGLHDRGLLRTGLKADVNIIDYARIGLKRPTVTYDLPSQGRRVTQAADGYVATIVNGEITYREGQAMSALPGRLVRGPQLGMANP